MVIVHFQNIQNQGLLIWSTGPGRFDAIIHNASVYQLPAQTILAVNTLAPYILTCLIEPPECLIYLSSGDLLNGDPTLDGLRADPPKALVWLAVSDAPKALESSRCFRHQREARHQVKADDADLQEQFLNLCGQISGVLF